MLDMSSKVTDTISNDKLKIKSFLLLSLNLEVESFQNLSPPQKKNRKYQDRFLSPPPPFPP